jgi:tetratricopeptide (TPR) repeat protein
MADPSYFPAQYNLGLLSYQTGQTMKSLSAFETALALDPNSAEARYNFALALQKAKYPLDAVEELNRLLESYPGNLRAHLLLGNVYAQDLQDIERARSQYQTVLQLDSDHPQAPAIRAWMLENP